MKLFKRSLMGLVILSLVMVVLVGCGVPQADYDELNTEYTTLQADYDELDTEYMALQADYDELNTEYEAVQNALAEVEAVYPPKDFSSLSELQNWLLTNDVSERPLATIAENLYSKALEMQEDALKDGYIVSAWIDYYPDTEEFYINCTAVVDGNVWIWNPETDEPLDFSGISGLLKVK